MKQNKRRSRERGKMPTAVLKAKLQQTMGVERNGGQERTHGVDKMDTEGNSQEGKTGHFKGGGIGWCEGEGLTRI